MKNLPLGIQTFEKIITDEYLYIDKTKDIFELLRDGGTYYFISRPRRFGKSLFISTLKEIFSGNKELFKGLWIYDKIEWKKYPVIHIDFTAMLYTHGVQGFESSFYNKIVSIAEDYKLTLQAKNYKEAFNELIKKLAEQEKVVILIDEYDKPIVNFIEKPDIANEMRDILKNFYESIKESDKYIRFAFLTGVSKFSKVSVFSGLNNLTDITLDEKYSTLFGYTENDLINYFDEYFEKLTNKFSLPVETLRKEVKNWYNGYSWDGKNFVYNPYSILALFYHNDFGNYWFSTGTPTFLIKVINEYNVNISSLEDYIADINVFDSFDINKMNIYSLLFQTGYLTIKKINSYSITDKEYILNYPNNEVKDSLLKSLLADITQKNGQTGATTNRLVRCLVNKDLEAFFTNLKSIFASIPSHIFIRDKEAYYHTVIYLVLALINVRIKTEVHTNKGRIDAVIETDKVIYIMEFKLGNAEKALEQIENMKYHEKYLSAEKEITLIGIGFYIDERNIDNYLIKGIKQ